jgi:hypothetical protein
MKQLLSNDGEENPDPSDSDDDDDDDEDEPTPGATPKSDFEPQRQCPDHTFFAAPDPEANERVREHDRYQAID